MAKRSHEDWGCLDSSRDPTSTNKGFSREALLPMRGFESGGLLRYAWIIGIFEESAYI
ncbi:hypothetical protein [Shewanella sp.]|uniref:hypothetical protein n=1 Tax=Shewanella sp. TaxID=50422 RepID=UPI0025870FC7|nr:hypothetical protein [Shewanella sp.]MCJ8303080.1 hypothetical protein [Shewanella sp.]